MNYLIKHKNQRLSILMILYIVFISGINLSNLGAAKNDKQNFLDKSIYKLNSNDIEILKTNYSIGKKYIKELKKLGFKKIQVDDIINLKKFNTTIQYINDIKKIKPFHLTIDEVASMSKYGVTIEYINLIRKESAKQLSFDEIVDLAKNNIQPYLIKELTNIGYKNIEPWLLKKIIKNKVSIKFLKTVFDSSDKTKIEIIKTLIKKGYIDQTSDFDYNKAIKDNKISEIKLDQAINLWKIGFKINTIKKKNKRGKR